MSRADLEALVRRFESDVAFRARVRRDPAAAVREAGLNLTPAELSVVQNASWNLSDEELLQRAKSALSAQGTLSTEATGPGSPGRGFW